MIPTPLRLLGAPGSPYTRKMLALLRYRRIPYQLILQGSRESEGLPRPRVPLLPTFFLPAENAASGDGGELEAVTDSTPLIRRFEVAFEGRSVIPGDPALAFLDLLLEDFADEWLTKAMFHYRWHFAPDIEKARRVLPLWANPSVSDEAVAPFQAMIGERQIERLRVVGSNEATAPVIEASYRRILQRLDAHWTVQPFLFGGRPASADFALFGQLTQLVGFDPTPAALALETSPRVVAQVDRMEDLSGLEVDAADWIAADAVSESLRDLLREVGRGYVPVMLANARAVAMGAEVVETQVDGARWTQRPFPYQAKCLGWLRDAHAALDPAVSERVDALLAGSGCEPLFAASLEE